MRGGFGTLWGGLGRLSEIELNSENEVSPNCITAIPKESHTKASRQPTEKSRKRLGEQEALDRAIEALTERSESEGLFNYWIVKRRVSTTFNVRQSKVKPAELEAREE